MDPRTKRAIAVITTFVPVIVMIADGIYHLVGGAPLLASFWIGLYLCSCTTALGIYFWVLSNKELARSHPDEHR